MKFKTALLTASCALALAACGSQDRPADADPPSDATTMPADTTAPDMTAQDATPVDAAGGGDADPTATPNSEHTAAGAESDLPAEGDAAATVAEGDSPATVADCATTIEGNDRMQYNVDSITIPSSCSEFTINLNHTGALPVAAMGHNVVVTAASDYTAVAAAGLTAGADADYVPQGDERVIAATDMVGGGESTSVTFSTGGLDSGSEYTFFCSFPGHSALMRGTLRFGG